MGTNLFVQPEQKTKSKPVPGINSDVRIRQAGDMGKKQKHNRP